MLHRGAAWLALAFLAALGLVLPQLDQHWLPAGVIRGAEFALLACWALLAVELLLRRLWVDRQRSWGRLAYQAGCLLVPPLRLGLSAGRSHRGIVWLPAVGWRRTGRETARRLQRALSGPMIVIGLMVVPALALDFLYKDTLEDHPAIAIGLDIGLRLIWLAFAFELVVMLAVSREKLGYARAHWVDVAIVVFPLISFLRVLRLLRLGSVVRASRLATMARTYRLRGLAMRLMRAVLLLRVLERISHRAAEARVRMLEAGIEKHRRQIDEMEREIAELRKHIDAKRAHERAREQACEAAGEYEPARAES